MQLGSAHAGNLARPPAGQDGHLDEVCRITRLSEPENWIAPYRKLSRLSVLPAPHRPRLIARTWLNDEVEALHKAVGNLAALFAGVDGLDALYGQSHWVSPG
jgi:hypothetical protein